MVQDFAYHSEIVFIANIQMFRLDARRGGK